MPVAFVRAIATGIAVMTGVSILSDRVRSAEQAATSAGKRAQRAVLLLFAALVVSSVLTPFLVWYRTSSNADEAPIAMVRECTTLAEEEEGARSRDGSTPVIEDRGFGIQP